MEVPGADSRPAGLADNTGSQSGIRVEAGRRARLVEGSRNVDQVENPHLPRVLLVHNRYQERAGEDLSFDADRRVLAENGVEITEYVRDNREIEGAGPFEKLRMVVGTSWAAGAKAEIRELLKEWRPDVVHFHNTFPLISPAPYWACRAAGVPVVQTLRNFRIFCAPGILFRDGHICHDCVGKLPQWPGVLHACYRGSRSQTVPVTAMQTFHGLAGTWTKLVDAYIAASPFMRSKLIELGLPSEKIHVRADVVEGVSPGNRHAAFALFVGRLTVEKGVRTLLDAWSTVVGMHLKLVGTGPLETEVRERVSSSDLHGRVEVLGPLPSDQTIALIREAAVVVVPSESYETFGRVPLEAAGCGVPTIASRLGALTDTVQHGVTGLLFSPGVAADLAAAACWVRDHPDEMVEMGSKAREQYELHYSPSSTFERLMEIYGLVCR
ncbi:MAG: glycosyltransferase family 4 protein [Actinomycetota bacterium]